MATERELIAGFLKAFPASRALLGPGDDAAVVARGQGDLCVTTDSVVEGVHFTLRHFSAEEIGHKALAVNLSDLAAMGADPRWFLCALALPLGTSPVFVGRLARGMATLARRHRVDLVGGNFSRAREISVTITCAGEVPHGRALRRDGGRPGDVLYVSGTLGDARAGLLALRRGQRRGPLEARQRCPTPRVALGKLARGHARAAIDVSDGFVADLGELCRRSQTGARVDAQRIPLSAALRRRSPHPARRARAALQGGEDYELILAVPRARAGAFERACARAGHQVSAVGELTRTPGVQFLWGEVAFHPPDGFDHFA